MDFANQLSKDLIRKLSRIISIIPARSGSKGLKNKNILNFHGKPLINWSILYSLKNKLIDSCIVTTDSIKIAKIAKEQGAEVPFIRDKNLASDKTPTSEVILDVIEKCDLKDQDIILLLEPTSPYRTIEDFHKGLNLLKKNNCKKVVSVSQAISSSFRFQFMRSNDAAGSLLNLEFNNCPNDMRRQEIIKTYFLDGSFYFSNVKAFKDNHGFIGESTGTFETNYFSTFEIDTYNDFKLLESLFESFGMPF
tara:strand:+ start:35043 stop:35792 length:750 start_codon:yes stop_codon:yes gene_type:complete